MTPEQQLYKRLRDIEAKQEKLEEKQAKLEQDINLLKDNAQVHMERIFKLEQQLKQKQQ